MSGEGEWPPADLLNLRLDQLAPEVLNPHFDDREGLAAWFERHYPPDNASVKQNLRLLLDRAFHAGLIRGFHLGWRDADAARTALGALLNELTPVQQRVLQLIYEGRTYEEIAEAIGVSTPEGAQYHVREAAKRRGMTMRELRRAVEAKRART